jgi:hypothetical protein
MNIGTAKAIARQWLAEEWEETPGFLGAIYCGSTNWKSDETEYVPPSDIDILIWSVPSIIADPTGRLTALHRAVAPEYARRKWVRARCERPSFSVPNSLLTLVWFPSGACARLSTVDCTERQTSGSSAQSLSLHLCSFASLR